MVICMVQVRLEALRNAMKENGIDCYIIPTSDFHNSEYVSEYFMVRKYFSGFTGSAGTLVVCQDKAALFTDGRYFIQAKEELLGSDITLMRTGEPDVPTLTDYVSSILSEGQNIGFDGRVMTADDGLIFEAIAKEKKGNVICDKDIAQGIWQNRPKLPATDVSVLKECYCGEKTEEKLMRLRECMDMTGADTHILTTLDDIAWLFNLRAHDVESCPVFLSYTVIMQTDVFLFASECAFDDAVKNYLSDRKITLRAYDEFYEFIKDKIKEEALGKVLLCEDRISYRLKKELEGCELINRQNPTSLMKAVKNATEQENIRKAHLMDGVAVTKFMYWLKSSVGKTEIDEQKAAEYLEMLRKENDSFIEPSFPTICAYGANGAIIHYSTSKEQSAPINAGGMLMVDSGGHYLEGSTDVTRTFVLGRITDEMKMHFTLVVKAMLRLRNAKFLYGAKGVNLDILAREALWEYGLDYKHGTGHGVGYLLNVHEGPNSFRTKPSKGDADWCFEEGMITTDEPGIYIENKFGVRIEDMVLITENGFENLTHSRKDLRIV